MRCKDLNFNGKATESCNIKYSEHNYVKFKKIAKVIIISKDVTFEDMNKQEFQKAYFIIIYENFPNLTYD